jgi:XTP/dITP diphosphohydrolase
MKELFFASQNSNKIREISEILKDKYKIVSLADLNDDMIVEETESTLEGNAIIKARYLFNKYGKPCFADDSGLEIEALNGAPGVYSARYAGEDCDSLANMNKVLDRMHAISNRKARFRTVIAYICSRGEILFEGAVSGVITSEMRGTDGFGYDPIFQPDGGNGLTFAQMSSAQKNSMSHRAEAIRYFVNFLIRNDE